MTSEYDKLNSISSRAQEDKSFFEIANWLLDICIEQANNAKKGWNFEVWKSTNLEMYKKLYPNWEFRIKAGFMDDCHDVLGHQGIEAFDWHTHKLVHEVYNAVSGGDVYDIDKLKKRFPQLPGYLESIGYKPLDKRGWMWAKQ